MTARFLCGWRAVVTLPMAYGNRALLLLLVFLGFLALMMTDGGPGGGARDGVAAADFVTRDGAHGRALGRAGRLLVLLGRMGGDTGGKADQNGGQHEFT